MYVTKNQLSRNEIWCAADNQNYMSNVQRIFFKSLKFRTLIKQLLTKYQFSTKWPQISHTHKNRNVKSIIRNG